MNTQKHITKKASPRCAQPPKYALQYALKNARISVIDYIIGVGTSFWSFNTIIVKTSFWFKNEFKDILVPNL